MKIIVNETQYNKMLKEQRGFSKSSEDWARVITDKVMETLFDIDGEDVITMGKLHQTYANKDFYQKLPIESIIISINVEKVEGEDGGADGAYIPKWSHLEDDVIQNKNVVEDVEFDIVMKLPETADKENSFDVVRDHLFQIFSHELLHVNEWYNRDLENPAEMTDCMGLYIDGDLHGNAVEKLAYMIYTQLSFEMNAFIHQAGTMLRMRDIRSYDEFMKELHSLIIWDFVEAMLEFNPKEVLKEIEGLGDKDKELLNNIKLCYYSTRDEEGEMAINPKSVGYSTERFLDDMSKRFKVRGTAMKRKLHKMATDVIKEDKNINENDSKMRKIKITEEQLKRLNVSMLTEQGNITLPRKFEEIPGGQDNYRTDQPSIKQLKSIIENYGIKNVIRMNAEEGTGVTPNAERELVEKMGVNYIWLNAHKGFKKGQGYLTSMDVALPILEEGHTLIHCTGGRDRTGYIVAEYLQRNFDWDKDKLWEYTVGFNKWEDHVCKNTKNKGYIKYMEGFYPLDEWCENYDPDNKCPNCRGIVYDKKKKNNNTPTIRVPSSGRKSNDFEKDLDGKLIRRWGKNKKQIVKRVQKILYLLDYDLGIHKIDGKFGPDTEKAVKEFQKDVFTDKEEWDGIVGPNTYEELIVGVDSIASKKGMDREDLIDSVDDADLIDDIEDDEYEDDELLDMVTNNFECIPAKWAPIFDLINKAESKNGGYESLNPGTTVSKKHGHRLDGKHPTELTFKEIADIVGKGPRGTDNPAVGMWQFISLLKQAKKAGFNEDDLFSKCNQDKMAMYLMIRKRKVTLDLIKNNPTQAGNNIAMEWAGMPVLSNINNKVRGESYYEGSINSSNINPKKVESTFKKMVATVS